MAGTRFNGTPIALLAISLFLGCATNPVSKDVAAGSSESYTAASVESGDIQMSFTFDGDSPAKRLPWTESSVQPASVVINAEWTLGGGLKAGSGDDRLMGLVREAGSSEKTLSEALADNDYFSLVLDPDDQDILPIGGARITMNWVRDNWNSARQFAVFTGKTGFSQGDEVYTSRYYESGQDWYQDEAFVVPEGISLAAGESIEIRIVPFKGNWSYKPVSLDNVVITMEENGAAVYGIVSPSEGSLLPIGSPVTLRASFPAENTEDVEWEVNDVTSSIGGPIALGTGSEFSFTLDAEHEGSSIQVYAWLEGTDGTRYRDSKTFLVEGRYIADDGVQIVEPFTSMGVQPGETVHLEGRTGLLIMATNWYATIAGNETPIAPSVSSTSYTVPVDLPDGTIIDISFVGSKHAYDEGPIGTTEASVKLFVGKSGYFGITSPRIQNTHSVLQTGSNTFTASFPTEEDVYVDWEIYFQGTYLSPSRTISDNVDNPGYFTTWDGEPHVESGLNLFSWSYDITDINQGLPTKVVASARIDGQWVEFEKECGVAGTYQPVGSISIVSPTPEHGIAVSPGETVHLTAQCAKNAFIDENTQWSADGIVFATADPATPWFPPQTRDSHSTAYTVPAGATPGSIIEVQVETRYFYYGIESEVNNNIAVDTLFLYVQ